MGSSYLGGPYLGIERSGGSSSSRKGKKPNNTNSENKPKNPQRGLGVAQLEKIRLHTQLASSFNQGVRMPTGYASVLSPSLPSTALSPSSFTCYYGFHSPTNTMVSLTELQGTNISYVDSQPTTKPRWNPVNGMLEIQQFPVPPSMARNFLNSQAEDSEQMRRKQDWVSDSIGAGIQNRHPISDTQELDLELRL